MATNLPDTQPTELSKIDLSIASDGSAVHDSAITIGDVIGRDKHRQGDEIHAAGSQGFVNRPNAPVTQHFGNTINLGPLNISKLTASIALGAVVLVVVLIGMIALNTRGTFQAITEGNTAGFCPDNLTFATGFAAAKADETLVVVSNFADTLGNDPRNLTFDLVERMQETLATHTKIRVERLNCAIKQQKGSETAMRIGSRKDVDASIVIWGVYVEPPEPEVRLYFDIVKHKETYLSAGFDRSFGPQAIQPSMFDFKASLGTQVGEAVAFAAGLTLFNAGEHLAAEPLFTTAIAVADQPLATEFTRALRYYRAANYWFLGRFLEAKPEIDRLHPRQALTIDTIDDLDLPILNLLGGVYYALGDKQQALDFYNQALPLSRAVGDKAGEAATLNNIGGVYYALGDTKKALEYLSKAGDVLHEIGEVWSEVTLLSNIAYLQFQRNDLVAAAETLETAIAIAKKLNHPEVPQLQEFLADINAKRKE